MPPAGNDTASGDKAIDFSAISGSAATVTTVEFTVELASPDAVSVAVMVAVALTAALDATVSRPAELTVATAELEEAKLSPDAARAALVLLL